MLNHKYDQEMTEKNDLEEVRLIKLARKQKKEEEREKREELEKLYGLEKASTRSATNSKKTASTLLQYPIKPDNRKRYTCAACGMRTRVYEQTNKSRAIFKHIKFGRCDKFYFNASTKRIMEKKSQGEDDSNYMIVKVNV